MPDSWNQSPSDLDLHTNQDMNHLANLRHNRDHRIASELLPDEVITPDSRDTEAPQLFKKEADTTIGELPVAGGMNGPPAGSRPAFMQHTWRVIKKFGKFIGPGFMIAVAYIDPGRLCCLSECFRLLTRTLQEIMPQMWPLELPIASSYLS